MKRSCLLATSMLLCLCNLAVAQHAGDIELGYDNRANPTSLVIEPIDSTSDGILYFESEFEELDPFTPGDFSADEPGFNTNAGENLLVNAGDQIWLNTLDASTVSAFGVGVVNFYNPTTDALEATGRLAIQDNSAVTADLVLSGGVFESGVNPQFIDLGDSAGDIHDHVIFDLLDDATAANGAYGVLFELQSDFATADGNMDLTSDPFWVIFNHGMSEAAFESAALPAFGVTAVPEPSSFMLMGLTAGIVGLRRRRR